MGWQFPHDKEFTSSRNILPRTSSSSIIGYRNIENKPLPPVKNSHSIHYRYSFSFRRKWCLGFLVIVILRVFEVKTPTRVSGGLGKIAKEGK